MTFRPFRGDIPFQESAKMYPPAPATHGAALNDTSELDDLFVEFSDPVEHTAPVAGTAAINDATDRDRAAGDDVEASDAFAALLWGIVEADRDQHKTMNHNTAPPREHDQPGPGQHGNQVPADTAAGPGAVFGADSGAPVSDALGGGRLASRRALQDEAFSQLGTVSVDHHAAERRNADLERLYATIDRITAIVAADPELNNLASSFELTKDRDLDARQRHDLETRVGPKLLEHNVYIDSARDSGIIYDMLYDELLGISVLGGLWRDDDIADICIDAWDRVSVERGGRLMRTDVTFRSHDHAVGVVRALSRKMSDRQVSPTNPLVTATLPAARVQFVYGDLSASGLAVVIRKFKPLLGMRGLLEVDALDADMASFLAACVRARATVLVSGGTGTGKTTMINALSEFIPDDERVLSIEDAFELQLSNSNWVPLQSKQRASADDTNITTQADLMVATLRMRPDRIIVGEIREADAAAVMFDAASTGHDGTMTTIHAESSASAVNNRLTVMLMRSDGGFSEDIARLTVAQTVHLVVQITRKYGRRFVSEIAVVDERYIDERKLIAPVPVFRSRLDLEQGPDGPVVVMRHEQISRVERDTALAVKLADAGEDAARWIAA